METAGRERRPVPPRSSSDDDDLFLPSHAGARGAVAWGRERSRDFGSVSSEDCAAWSPEPRDESDVNKYGAARGDRMRVERQGSIVDGLLFEIYDRWHGRERDSLDSDTFTECSSTSEIFGARADSYQAVVGRRHARQLNRSYLQGLTKAKLRGLVEDLTRSITQESARLVRQLKRRDRRLAKLQRNSDLVTAILQASSQKRRIDTRMRFSLEPPMGESAFQQWRDAMKAVARLPLGIPPEFRRKVWLSLADNYIKETQVDWDKTVRFTFNEKSNPDDDRLGLQIVKDLHRTGCSSFSGQDNEEERAVLKRVLLAYARWNKSVGYCQGFNVIAALLLNVTDRKEDDALKVMIYLIDKVLPESYFDNNLRALSVDMAVFRDLLRLTFPPLARHLDHLQSAAQDSVTGGCYEPPLTNVFTMQWFLTLFATCLPKSTVLRVWDSILLEGSEILLRTALAIWGRLARRIMGAASADEFYSLMGELTADMLDGRMFDADEFIKAIYSVAPSPFPQLAELREKYTYNIRPFTSGANASKKASRVAKATVLFNSDEDDLDDEDIEAITCFPGILPLSSARARGGEGEGGGMQAADMATLGPGAFGAGGESGGGPGISPVYQERMSTDITSLTRQYQKLRQRQRQAHVIIAAASAKQQQRTQMAALVPKIQSPTAMNHLFVGKKRHSNSSKNRVVTEGPFIGATRQQQQGARLKSSPSTDPPRASPVSPATRSAKQSRSSSGSSKDALATARVGVHTLAGVPATEPTPFSLPPSAAAESEPATAADAESSDDAEVPTLAAKVEGAQEGFLGEDGQAKPPVTEETGEDRCVTEESEPLDCHTTKEELPDDDKSQSPSSKRCSGISCDDGDEVLGCAEVVDVSALSQSQSSPSRSVHHSKSSSMQVSQDSLCHDTKLMSDEDPMQRPTSEDVEVMCYSHDNSVMGNSVQGSIDASMLSHATSTSRKPELTSASGESAEVKEGVMVDCGVDGGSNSPHIAVECASESVIASNLSFPPALDIVDDILGDTVVHPQQHIPENGEKPSLLHCSEMDVSDLSSAVNMLEEMGSIASKDTEKAELMTSSKEALIEGVLWKDSERCLGKSSSSDRLQDNSRACNTTAAATESEKGKPGCAEDDHRTVSLPSKVIPPGDADSSEISPTKAADPVSKEALGSEGSAASIAVASVADASLSSPSPSGASPESEAGMESQEKRSENSDAKDSETSKWEGRSASESSGGEVFAADCVPSSPPGDLTSASSPSTPGAGSSQHLNGCLVKNGTVTSPGKPRSGRPHNRHVSFSEPDTDSEWTPSDTAIARSLKSRHRLQGSSSLQESTQYVTKFVYVASKQSSQRPPTQRSLSAALSTSPLSPTSPSAKPFNPFPMRHINTNRTKAGVKLGLYSASTLDQLGQGMRKTRGKEKL